MIETNAILEFAEDLIHQKTETYCSELQRRILSDALQEDRRTYDQLAEECGYSPRYVKQDVAPKLWLLISQAVGEKVNKANVRAALEAAMRRSLAEQTSLPQRKIEKLESGSTLPFEELSVSLEKAKSNILLVDDQPQNLKLLSDLLEEQGYEVQQAINGAIALQAIRSSPPDLVLLDIHMPQMDGYALCQHIKADQQTSDIPIIFVSAIDEPWDKVKAFSAGGCDYITKPFKVVEVLARVENHLKIQQLQKTLIAQNMKLQRAIQELQRLAAIDEVTQVACRRRFDAYLLECWQKAESAKTSLSLLLVYALDIHSDRAITSQRREDSTLRSIAQAIQQAAAGPQDLVARYGTFTFAVLLPDQKKGESFASADTMLKRIEETLLIRIESKHRLSDTAVSDCLLCKSADNFPFLVSVTSVDFSSEMREYSDVGGMLSAAERALQKARSQTA